MTRTPEDEPHGKGSKNHAEYEERMKNLEEKIFRKLQRERRQKGASTGGGKPQGARFKPATLSIAHYVASALCGILRVVWRYRPRLGRRLLLAMAVVAAAVAAIAALVCLAEGAMQALNKVPVIGPLASWTSWAMWGFFKGVGQFMTGTNARDAFHVGLPHQPGQLTMMTPSLPPMSSDLWTTDVSIYPHAQDMHRNIGFMMDMVEKGDNGPNLVAGRIVNEAISQNRLLVAEGSTGLAAGDPSPLRLVLSKTANTVAEMTQQDRLFITDAATMLRTIFRKGRQLEGVLEETVRLREVAASKIPAVPTLFHPFLTWVQHLAAPVGRWMGREDQALKQVARRLVDLGDLLDHSIETHSALSKVFDIKLVNAVNGGVDIQAQLCGLHYVLLQALEVSDYRLSVAIDAGMGPGRGGERGVSYKSPQDQSLSSVKTLGAAARELFGIEAVGSLLCRQAKGSVAQFELRTSTFHELQEDMIQLRSRVNVLTKQLHETDRPSDLDLYNTERASLDVLREFLGKLNRVYLHGP